MKYTLVTLMTLILWAILGLIGYRNVQRIVEIRPQVAMMREVVQRRNDFDRQQIRLCELALASQRDASTIDLAEAKFREIRKRYGQLPIADPQQVSIVTIPELAFRERSLFAWRVSVPPGQRVELAGYLTGDSSLSAKPIGDDHSVPPPDSFAKALPVGESVILVEWREPYTYKWGSSEPDDRSPTMVTVSVVDDEFRWKSGPLPHNQLFLRPERYSQPQTLFATEDSTQIMEVGDIRILVRRADPVQRSEP